MTISPALFPAVTVKVVRDRKIRNALRTNKSAGFVIVPSWEKIRSNMKMSNNPAKYEVLIKQHLRSILDISEDFLSLYGRVGR